MADPMTMAMVSAGVGAATSDDPLEGALIGGIGGFAGGHALGAMAAPGSAGSTGTLAGLNNLGMGAGIAPVNPMIGVGAGDSAMIGAANALGDTSMLMGTTMGEMPSLTSGHIGNQVASAMTPTTDAMLNLGGGYDLMMSPSLAPEMAEATMPFGQSLARDAFKFGDKMKGMGDKLSDNKMLRAGQMLQNQNQQQQQQQMPIAAAPPPMGRRQPWPIHDKDEYQRRLAANFLRPTTSYFG